MINNRELSLNKWIEVAIRHYKEYEIPNLNEGLNKIYAI